MCWLGDKDFEYQSALVKQIEEVLGDRPDDFLNCLHNCSTEIQAAYYSKLLEKYQDDPIMLNKLWNMLSFPTDEINRDMICRIFPDMTQEQVNEIMEKYFMLTQMNPGISHTLNLRILDPNIFSQYDFEMIARISVLEYTWQEKFISHAMDAENNYLLQKAYHESHNKEIVLSKMIDSLEKHAELLSNLSIEDVQEPYINSIINYLLSDEQAIKIDTIEKLKHYNEIKKEIFIAALEGRREELPDNWKKVDEIVSKRYALLQLMYGIGIEEAQRLVRIYGTKIDELSCESAEEKKIKQYLINIKTILEMEHIDDFYRENREQILNLEELPCGFTCELQGEIIKIYEEAYRKKCYHPKESDLQREPAIYQAEDGTLHKVPVYEVHDDFYMLARSEGAYNPSYREPDNFRDAIYRAGIKYHGNCESFISQQNMGIARPKGPLFGYTNTNGLLFSAPYDIGSSIANTSLDASNGKTMKPQRVLPPDYMIDYTRHGHNEITFERLLFDEKTQSFSRREPDYVLWTEDETNQDKTPEEIKELREKDPRWEMTKKAAAQFGIPIVVINREDFAIKETKVINDMISQLHEAKESDIPRFQGLISEIITRFENNASGMQYSPIKEKYFTSEQRKALLETLINEVEGFKAENEEVYYQSMSILANMLEAEVEKRKVSGERVPKELSSTLLTVNHSIGEEGFINENAKTRIGKIISNINEEGFYEGNKQHSVEHIEKVIMFSYLLAEKEGLSDFEERLLLTAAAFHDSGRKGLENDEAHAEKSAEFFGEYMRSHRGGAYGNFKDVQIRIIQLVIEYHEQEENVRGQVNEEKIQELVKKYGLSKYFRNEPNAYQRTKKICAILKDADALDRYRFAKRGRLDTSYLRTDSAKEEEVLAYAQMLNSRYAMHVLEENYGVSQEMLGNHTPMEVLREKRIHEAREEKRIPIEKKKKMLSLKRWEQPKKQEQEELSSTNIRLIDIKRTVEKARKDDVFGDVH